MTSLTTSFIRALIDGQDPVPLIVGHLMTEIWVPSEDQSLEDYYWEGEKAVTELERALNGFYGELYSEHLPYQCVHEGKNLGEIDGCILIMDGLSLRESALIIPEIIALGYHVNGSFGTSAIPSETLPFREKIGFQELKKHRVFAAVGEIDPKLTGEEELIWCRYPDALYENIQAGRTKIGSIEEMYEKTLSALLSILSQVEPPMLLTSDHGYVRTEAGSTFAIAEPVRRKLREALGGQRYAPMEEANLGDLVNQGALVEYDGKYLARARTTWPVQGKYSVFNHGGVSLMECITPKLYITKDQ